MSSNMPWPQAPVGNKDYGKAAVVIIGGGISGICLAIDLIKRNNCRNFVILEKSVGVGGTWNDNRYPGCCCDVWSSLYSYSFAQNTNWSREYPGQEEILAYLVQVTQDYNLNQHFRFNSTVEDARWDDATKQWKTKVSVAKGSKDAEFSPEYTITSDFLVSAVGQLNQPRWPTEIKGFEKFTGKQMHSARWDWSYDIRGKKVALVGNGCTAVQILPEIQKVAKSVTLFQRTPNWVVPRQDAPISGLKRNIYRYLPPVLWLKRAYHMSFRETLFSAVVNPKSDLAEYCKDLSLKTMRAQIPDRPDLWEKLTPNYSIGCKRLIISDDYFPSLIQPNVVLETRPIDHIAGSTIKARNNDGTLDGSDYDLIVCATGFKSVDFMHPIQLTGRNGRSLNDIWKDGPRAHYGMSVEDMPNFAMLYGPNTNLGHNSIILMIEAQSRYINGLIGATLQAKRERMTLSICPKKQTIEESNEILQAALHESSFNDPNCNSWYKNEAGLITNNWSGTAVQYQKLVAKVNFDDYDLEGSAAQGVTPTRVLKVGRVVEELQLAKIGLIAGGLLSAVLTVAGRWILY